MTTQAKYDDMLFAVTHRYCWWCRAMRHWMGLHRHHIVTNPRLPDRRCCIILCGMCHHLVHNGWKPGWEGKQPPTLAEQLALKEQFDPDYYDLEFLRQWAEVRAI